MKFGLVNPAWTYERSTYFGCQDPHYPLELLFAEQQIRAAGHEPLVAGVVEPNEPLVSPR